MPLVTNVEGTGSTSSTQETPLIHKFLVRQPVKKETAADPDYHPDSMSDAESDSDPCSDAVLSPDLVTDKGANVCTIAPAPSSGKSLLSKEGKGNVERENAWQAMGFAAAEKPSACSECWGCWRNKHCYEVAKWERKQAAILKDQSSPSLFLARARTSATIASQKAEESLSQDSLPSVNSLSPPLTEKGAASQGTFPPVGSFTGSSLSGTSSANPSSQSSSNAKSGASSPTVGFWKKFCPPSSPLGSPHPGISSLGCSLARSSLPGSSLPGISSLGRSLARSSLPGSSPPGNSLPGGSFPGSSLPGSSSAGSAPAASSPPLNQEN